MNEVTLDPQQAPARAELLLVADFGQEAAGRPTYGRLESEDDGDGPPGPRVKIGAVRTRRLVASEAVARLSGSTYGNPLRGTRDAAPAVPVGAPVVARVDAADARGWRVYRAAPNGAVIFDGWIEHDPANAEQVLIELRAAAAASPAEALRRAAERQPRHASADVIARWLAGRESERPTGRSPGRGRPGGGGGAPSRGKAAGHDAPHGLCLCRRREETPAWLADAVHRHAADGPDDATILTTAHRPDSRRLTVRRDRGPFPPSSPPQPPASPSPSAPAASPASPRPRAQPRRRPRSERPS